MKIVLIVAVCESNFGIGKENQLLWHLPADMKFFRETTMGFPVITGRKNYESIPEKFRPLSGRKNIVVTRESGYRAEGAFVCNSISSAIELAGQEKSEKCFIIGGGQIYEQFLKEDLVDELIITWVDAKLEADTFFKGFDPKNWSENPIMSFEKDTKNPFDFKIVKYTRKLVA